MPEREHELLVLGVYPTGAVLVHCVTCGYRAIVGKDGVTVPLSFGDLEERLVHLLSPAQDAPGDDVESDDRLDAFRRALEGIELE